jgi:hypothetical protein
MDIISLQYLNEHDEGVDGRLHGGREDAGMATPQPQDPIQPYVVVASMMSARAIMHIQRIFIRRQQRRRLSWYCRRVHH